MTNQMLFFFSALGAFNGFMIAVYFAINANKKVLKLLPGIFTFNA